MTQQTIAPPVTFNKLSELQSERAITGIAYGGSGTGKTWFLGTFGNRTLLVDTGDGTDTFKSKVYRDKIGYDFTIVSIREKLGDRGMVSVANGYDLVSDTIDYVLNNLAGDFDSICVDELSSLRKFALYKGLEINQKTLKSQSKAKSEEHDAWMVAVQDWGIEMSLTEQFCVYFTDKCKRLGKNFWIAAHQRHLLVKPRDGKGNAIIGEPGVIKETRPAVTGAQFPDYITGLFDEVWHFERVGRGDNAVFRATLMGDEVTTAKTRHFGGVVGTVETNPHFIKMLEKLKGAK